MRLINISNLTALTLEDFIGDYVPAYGILSHTWDEEEVSFQAFSTPEARWFAGYKKIQGFCAIAAEDGLFYVWVDTCCIDKSSSAELSEAINSMYRWYAKAKRCYVYLSDLKDSLPSIDSSKEWVERSFGIIKNCRWFKRGWTLQELLAPVHIKFYNRQWISLGTKDMLCNVLSGVTGIQLEHLWDCNSASIAQRMSWAAHRVTTRIEDRAYCLLGIFDVNIPLLYGEGKKAFTRLQQEILRSSHDESLFAWTNEGLWTSGLLAESPADFAGSSSIVPFKSKRQPRRPYSMTNHGLQIELMRMSVNSLEVEQSRFKSPLLCKFEDQKNDNQITLYFNHVNDDPDEDHVVRTASYQLGLIDTKELSPYHSHEPTSFFVQDTTLLKEQPHRLFQHDLSTAGSIKLRLSGSLEDFDFRQLHELAVGKYGYLIANAVKLEIAYLCWPKENCNAGVVDIHYRGFDPSTQCWQQIDEWLAQISRVRGESLLKLRIGHPFAIWDGCFGVILIAARKRKSRRLCLDIQVDYLGSDMRQVGDIHLRWIGRNCLLAKQ